MPFCTTFFVLCGYNKIKILVNNLITQLIQIYIRYVIFYSNNLSLFQISTLYIYL